MSKTIQMPARGVREPDADQWVEQRAIAEPSKKHVKPKRLTIDIDPELHKRLKVVCAQSNIQIADLVRKQIKRSVEELCSESDIALPQESG